MRGHITLPVDHLRTVLEKILTHLERGGTHEITLEDNYFWVIPGDQLYDVYSFSPHTLTIGRLSESWQPLTAMLREDSEPTPSDLVKLADILHAIGHTPLPEHHRPSP
ncbi:hypothetical protein [Pseudonocardia spinosispora]|uniref:hypothetical protein n=1 Tax=Pseudonocardia spinosispora TaxID=103441 RepID=UPI00041E4D40|nr:hypothetical protein [Pseudonocardia spinosispora]